MLEHTAHYIGGRWEPSSGTETMDVINAATEDVIGRIPLGDAEDANKAVSAARAALPAWSATSPAERAGYLKRAAEGLQLRQTEIAMMVSQEVGMPFAYSNVIQVGLPVQSFVSIADIAMSFPFERQVYNSLVVREPIGVVVAITPWNYPLHQIAAKVAPALAAGCTVVLKPSEVAPLNAYALAEVFESIGLPPGVFNLVTGTGAEVGETLVGHPQVDMVSLTGSTVAGRRVGAVAAQTIKSARWSKPCRRSISFRHLWDTMVVEARERGVATSDALVMAASTLWATNDLYTEAMTTAYRETMSIEMVRNERERSALVDALLDGNIGGMTEVWDAAALLRLPNLGRYVVIAAEVPQIAQEALPGAESKLGRHGMSSAWCLQPDLQIGIACLGDDAKRMPHLLATLTGLAKGRVGVSPTYPALGETAAALRLARLALAVTTPGERGVVQFDASPLAVTAISAAGVLSRVSRTVLGPVLDLPQDEQSTLLGTLGAWRDNNGSAADAAATMYCHANTVRHRLHRIEELTGRSLSDPRAVADLCLALEGIRLLPGLPPA